MVKQNLLIILLVGAVLLAFLYFLWLCLRDAFTFVSDILMRKELDRMKVDTQALRAARQEEDARRLDNGCAHDWDSPVGALPPNACRNCGLERSRPRGDCDHVWRAVPGLLPISECEKCEKTHNGVLIVESVQSTEKSESTT